MLNIENAIRIEKGKYSKIYIFLCSDCKINEIRSEPKYLKKHKGMCKFCTHKGIPYLSSYNHFKDSVYRTNKKRIKQKEFKLSFQEFLEFTKIHNCHYCNKPILWKKHTGNGTYRYNLDRKDSNSGYIKDNLVVCCKECNFLKMDGFSYNEFKAIVELLDKMRNGTFIYKERV